MAVADYGAQDKGEMDLQAGMVVEVTEKSESGWWFVNAEEHQGWVPSTYLQAMNGSGSAQDSVHGAQDGQEEKYICIETFTADNSDEISLEKGAIVEVLQKNMDGWWTVRYDGSEGYAPATYLKKSTDPYAISLVEKSRQSGVQIIGNLADVSNLLTSASASPRNSAILSSSPTPRGKEKEEGEGEDGLGEEVKGGFKRDSSLAKVVLKQRSLERGGSLEPPPRQNSVKQLVVSPPPPPTPPGRPSTYVTIADFEDTVGDGISFTVGESVTVLEKTASGWWFVARGGDKGWVPESFLQQTDGPHTQVGSAEENGEGEEDDSDYEDEESDEEEQTQPPSAALASALQTRTKGVNGDHKSSTPSPWGPPSLPTKATPKPPSLPGKPQNQPESSQEHKREVAPGIANAMKSSKPSGPPSLPSKPSGPPAPPSKPGGDKPAPPPLPGKTAEKHAVPFKHTEKPKLPGLLNKPADKPGVPSVAKKPVEVSSAPGGVAGLASSLKSKFESKEQGGPVKSAGKPFVHASKPTPPSKAFGGGAVTPSFPHKPSGEGKPVLGQKPFLPFKANVASGDSAKPSLPSKASVGPPKLPFKPQAGPKSTSDSTNNNSRGADRPTSSRVHGLAAAFGKQDADLQDSKGTKPRPTLPAKKPTPPQLHTQKPGNRDSESPAGKPRVGNLVSELSGKLQFGGGGGGSGGGGGGSSRSPEPSPVSKTSLWSSQARNSSNKPSEQPPAPQLPKPMQSLLSQPKASSAAAVGGSSPGQGGEYEVVADFAAEGEGELCVQCGDVVQAVDQSQQDWWLVRLNADQGWVTSSYLEPAAQWDD
ncbi:hypothetical protein ACOMHN_022608 [Nucella lapillus]